MPRRIRFHRDFKKDLNAQLRWLATNRDDGWIERLRNDIEEGFRLLTRFPAVGTIEHQDGDMVLRRLILRNVPYVIYFVTNIRIDDGDVWILRLFHARQNRPVPPLPNKSRSRRKQEK
jgi:plasmid stabilization system protein ParE